MGAGSGGEWGMVLGDTEANVCVEEEFSAWFFLW